MDNVHEHKSYGQQFREDLSAEGWKKSVGPLFPSASDVKEEGKMIFNVLCKGPYHIGKFITSKHE